ncbi:hypothetical protein [Paludisphaera soli]|uniref:hypothetical protein n=1 Tax=Paludisphaera soli TaxID=2712865 RepID=UPI0013EC13B7|nr:hypothetical protein [Paludisphaera soli]
MDTDPEIQQTYRRALRVLRMVHELHKIGYQRIRIAPGMAPSGMYWRCGVTHAGNILKSHGAMMRDFHRDSIHYGSGQEDAYFGWEDARHDTVQALAARFLERCPEIARAGLGRDWAYAGWYVEMLGAAERGAFPIAYCDYGSDDPDWLMTTSDAVGRIPMPPGGEAA